MSTSLSLPVVPLQPRIFLVRGQKVMLDRDLAALYGVPAKRLNEAVKRNRERFPEDFAFLLTRQEVVILRSQIATSSWGGRRYSPYAFTEHGVAMLSAVLRSQRAVEMSIAIIRAFVRMRELLATDSDFAQRMEKLEAGHEQHASIINLLVEEIESIKALPEPRKKRIGFNASDG